MEISGVLVTALNPLLSRLLEPQKSFLHPKDPIILVNELVLKLPKNSTISLT